MTSSRVQAEESLSFASLPICRRLSRGVPIILAAWMITDRINGPHRDVNNRRGEPARQAQRTRHVLAFRKHRALAHLSAIAARRAQTAHRAPVLISTMSPTQPRLHRGVPALLRHLARELAKPANLAPARMPPLRSIRVLPARAQPPRHARGRAPARAQPLRHGLANTPAPPPRHVRAMLRKPPRVHAEPQAHLATEAATPRPLPTHP